MGGPDKQTTSARNMATCEGANKGFRDIDCLRGEQDIVLRRINKIHSKLSTTTPETAEIYFPDLWYKLRTLYQQPKALAEQEERSVVGSTVPRLNALISPGGQQRQLRQPPPTAPQETENTQTQQIASANRSIPTLQYCSESPRTSSSLAVPRTSSAPSSITEDQVEWIVVDRWKVYRKRHQQDADLIKTLLERDSAQLMSLRDLRKATNNFADYSQIGEGGFGTVYRGQLNDGTQVAIKRSKREGSESDKQQFLNEVRILSQVSHLNLVKLLGCCMENKIALLIFEFISNGTLQEHLEGKSGPVRLTWNQRLNIAVQTASALHYLHSAATFPIYHRDVKSANILLDDDLNAKVADFGISRLAPVRATHVSTLAVQGTIGYLDPEYYSSLQFSEKSDVYSFGVVLLELISAKPAIDFQRGDDEVNLVMFASRRIEKGDVQSLLDPALMETYNDPTGHGKKSILEVAALAAKCVDMRSKSRPTMNDVWKELQNLWLELNGTSNQLSSIIEDPQLDQRFPQLDSFPAGISLDSIFLGSDTRGNTIEMLPRAWKSSDNYL